MTERERIIEEARFIFCSEINGDAPNCTKELCPVCSFKIPRLEEAATKFLSLVEIRAENQDLPELNLPTLSGNKSLEITITSFAKKIRGDVLKAGFVKVIPKGR